MIDLKNDRNMPTCLQSDLLPKLDYYTLKQAVNELNQSFNRNDLDESYLIHDPC